MTPNHQISLHRTAIAPQAQPFLYETVSGTELNKILPMIYLADLAVEHRLAQTKVMVKYIIINALGQV